MLNFARIDRIVLAEANSADSQLNRVPGRLSRRARRARKWRGNRRFKKVAAVFEKENALDFALKEGCAKVTLPKRGSSRAGISAFIRLRRLSLHHNETRPMCKKNYLRRRRQQQQWWCRGAAVLLAAVFLFLVPRQIKRTERKGKE